MLGQFSLRAILLWIIAFMGMLAMVFALSTGELYTRITLDNQRAALTDLVELKTRDLLQGLTQDAGDLGLALQSDGDFNKAFDGRSSDAIEAQLTRQFHQYFVTASTLDLLSLRVYDLNFKQLAVSSGADGHAHSPCTYIIEKALRRRGADRQHLMSGLCATHDGVMHTVIVPVGGLHLKGYLEVSSNPIAALKHIEQALDMSLKINLADNGPVYRSVTWPAPDTMNNVLVATYILRDELGQALLNISIKDDMGHLQVNLGQTRIWVVGIAGIATLIAVLLVLTILQRYALRPLDTLTQHLRMVHEDRGHLGQPVALKGTREIRELTADFNEMTGELKDLYQTLEQMAFTDSLTRLPNRSRFLERLQIAAAVGRRNHQPFALLIMDLDRFKGVNDTLGHHVGDHLLKMVSDRLQHAVHNKTTQHQPGLNTLDPESDIIARLGGDEFAAILTAVNNRKDAGNVAQRLLECMQHPFMAEGHQFNIGISIGIVMYPEHGLDPSMLMRHADVAMYNAKINQRGYAFYDCGQDTHSLQKLVQEHDLRRAIDEESFEVYYQPKIDLSTGLICGAEALLRWPHPTRGFIPPDKFIHDAEQTGLIQPITYWVLSHAIEECARWHRSGMNISVAVNISPVMFREPTIGAEIIKTLNNAGLAPEYLVLELTESTVMTDPEFAQRILHDLDRMGVQLSIDDFGTGYSSLSYLRRLPVDEIKIDKSFVIDMQVNPHDAVIVRSTIDLAHNMDMRVVAEGVEDVEAFNRLTDWRCDMAQGFYLGHPIPTDQFFALITEHGRKGTQARA